MSFPLSRTCQFPRQVCYVLMRMFIFHLRLSLCISWTPSKDRLWGHHSEWTWGAAVAFWTDIGGNWNLRGWGPDKCILLWQPGRQTSWAFPGWLSDLPQLWGDGGDWGGGLSVLLQLSQRISNCLDCYHRFQYVHSMNCWYICIYIYIS